MLTYDRASSFSSRVKIMCNALRFIEEQLKLTEHSPCLRAASTCRRMCVFSKKAAHSKHFELAFKRRAHTSTPTQHSNSAALTTQTTPTRLETTTRHGLRDSANYQPSCATRSTNFCSMSPLASSSITATTITFTSRRANLKRSSRASTKRRIRTSSPSPPSADKCVPRACPCSTTSTPSSCRCVSGASDPK